jgi:hypothetical protein
MASKVPERNIDKPGKLSRIRVFRVHANHFRHALPGTGLGDLFGFLPGPADHVNVAVTSVDAVTSDAHAGQGLKQSIVDSLRVLWRHLHVSQIVEIVVFEQRFDDLSGCLLNVHAITTKVADGAGVPPALPRRQSTGFEPGALVLGQPSKISGQGLLDGSIGSGLQPDGDNRSNFGPRKD